MDQIAGAALHPLPFNLVTKALQEGAEATGDDLLPSSPKMALLEGAMEVLQEAADNQVATTSVHHSGALEALVAILGQPAGTHPAWGSSLITAGCFVGNYGDETAVAPLVYSILGSLLVPGLCPPEEGEPAVLSPALKAVEMICSTAEGAKVFYGLEDGGAARALAILGMHHKCQAALNALAQFFTCGAPLPEDQLRSVWAAGATEGASMGEAVLEMLRTSKGPLLAAIRRCVAGISCRTWASAEMVRTPGLVETFTDLAGLRSMEEVEKDSMAEASLNLMRSAEQDPLEDADVGAKIVEQCKAFVRRAR